MNKDPREMYHQTHFFVLERRQPTSDSKQPTAINAQMDP